MQPARALTGILRFTRRTNSRVGIDDHKMTIFFGEIQGKISRQVLSLDAPDGQLVYLAGEQAFGV
jgi:hypothetical protein